MQNGELEALSQRLNPELRRWLRRQRVPEADHDDLLQESLLALWSREDIAKPEAFVRATLHNRVLQYWRRVGRRGERALEYLDREPQVEPSRRCDDLRHDVERVVRQLSPRERKIAQLKLRHGMSCAEIAASTRETTKAVANVWWRVRRKLKSVLREEPVAET